MAREAREVREAHRRPGTPGRPARDISGGHQLVPPHQVVPRSFQSCQSFQSFQSFHGRSSDSGRPAREAASGVNGGHQLVPPHHISLSLSSMNAPYSCNNSKLKSLFFITITSHRLILQIVTNSNNIVDVLSNFIQGRS